MGEIIQKRKIFLGVLLKKLLMYLRDFTLAENVQGKKRSLRREGDTRAIQAVVLVILDSLGYDECQSAILHKHDVLATHSHCPSVE